MGQRHVCTFRHAQRAAYRTAISAAQTCLLCKIVLEVQHKKFQWLFTSLNWTLLERALSRQLAFAIILTSSFKISLQKLTKSLPALHHQVGESHEWCFKRTLLHTYAHLYNDLLNSGRCENLFATIYDASRLNFACRQWVFKQCVVAFCQQS